jgi:hypothetical protein
MAGFSNVCEEHVWLWRFEEESHSNKDTKEKTYEQLLDYYKQYDSSATGELVRYKLIIYEALLARIFSRLWN